MKSVEVLLRDHVPNLGKCGDVVKVAPGYARNFLIPRRIAIEATAENKRMMMRRRERLDIEEAARSAEIQAKVEALSALTVQTSERADENGHLYGSVTAHRIAELVTEKGFPIDERHVRVGEHIKSVGTHEVQVHVHGEHYASISVVVEASAAT